MIIRISFIFTALMFFFILLIDRSYALPLPSGLEMGRGYNFEDIDATFQSGTGRTPPTVTYDANTHVFTVSAELGRLDDSAFIKPLSTGEFRVRDIVGTFTLTATIDNTGKLQDGAFNWIGESAELGVSPSTILLQGRTVDAIFAIAQGGGFDLLAIVDFSHPALEAVVGPVRSLLIETFNSNPGPLWEENPWNSSFVRIAADSGPDLWGSPNLIPEPASVCTLLLGILGLGLMRRTTGRRRAVNPAVL